MQCGEIAPSRWAMENRDWFARHEYTCPGVPAPAPDVRELADELYYAADKDNQPRPTLLRCAAAALRSQPERDLHYALRPMMLTQEEAGELDRFRSRPSPLPNRDALLSDLKEMEQKWRGDRTHPPQGKFPHEYADDLHALIETHEGKARDEDTAL
jgi:hypothetical protein